MRSIYLFLKTNSWLAIAVAALALVLYQFVDPAPPREFTLATGGKEGRYYALGMLLKEELAREGVTVNVVSTSGSYENLERLVEPEGEVTIAFIQSGMDKMFEVGDAELWSLGSLYYEPIWVFYRRELELDSLLGLRGRRIAIGEIGSGTRAVAQYLLAENGLLGQDSGVTLLEEGGEDAVALLKQGGADAAFFTVSPQSAVMRELIELPEVDFLNIRRNAAYTARYPFISSVSISEGLLDLSSNIPGQDRTTLAATATLVVNDRFHPALTPLALETLARALRTGGILEQPDEFPSSSNVGFALTKEAGHYYEYGPPFLLRYLPFWAASLVDRLIIFIIPLLVILIPLSKLAGPVYRWRIRSRIYRWYRYLLDTDRRIVAGGSPDERARERERLQALARELASIEVPLSYADELYHLKQHVDYVSRRLGEDGAAEKRSSPKSAPP